MSTTTDSSMTSILTNSQNELEVNGVSASWNKCLINAKIVSNNFVVGTTKSEAKMKEIIDSCCRSLPCDFVKSHPSSLKGKQERNCISSRFLWKLKDIPYDGTPFCVLSSEILKCTFAMNYNSKKVKSEGVNGEIAGVNKNGSSFSLCPAKITVKKLKRYPSFSLSLKASKRDKLEKLKDMKQILDKNEKIDEEEIYWLSIPLPSYHNHGFQGKDRSISKKIIVFIKQMMNNGIYSPKELKALVSSHVKDMFKNSDFPPLLEDEAYYPTEENIRFIVSNFKKKMKNHIEFNAEDCGNKNSQNPNENNEILSWKPNSLQDLVEAFCKSPKYDPVPTVVEHPFPSPVSDLRGKINVEITRIIDVVNATANINKLEYILRHLQSLDNYEDTLVTNMEIGNSYVSVINTYENANH